MRHTDPESTLVLLLKIAALGQLLDAVGGAQCDACMVSDGLTPPTAGNTEPSQIHKLETSQLRQSALTTLMRGSAPMRAVPLRVTGVVILLHRSCTSAASRRSRMARIECRMSRLSLSP